MPAKNTHSPPLSVFFATENIVFSACGILYQPCTRFATQRFAASFRQHHSKQQKPAEFCPFDFLNIKTIFQRG